MKPDGAKTNAARILDRLNLPYQILTYPVDPQDLRAEATATKLGLPPQQVFKTLVLRASNQAVCLAVIGADSQIDLKALARLRGDRRIEPVPLNQVQTLTGYIRGGVTALGTSKPYPVYADQTITSFDHIAVSAGKRGLMLWLSPQAYLSATAATLAAISQPAQAY
ncbi:MAG: Cys-tRNA(Pro) deacylase [Cyanobacteria bacterium REEB459]|nr:Cys-tRNA(Pro) deacylase [Cyanobacteria bacterium REEB459]